MRHVILFAWFEFESTASTCITKGLLIYYNGTPKNDGLPPMEYTINHGNDITDIHDHLTNAHS